MDRGIAGRLNKRVELFSPLQTKSDYGGHQQGWRSEFTVWAAVKYLRGSEPVMAARLTGKKPAIFTIRKSKAALAIRTDWKLRFLDEDWNVNERPTEIEAGGYLQFLSTSGVAV